MKKPGGGPAFRKLLRRRLETVGA